MLSALASLSRLSVNFYFLLDVSGVFMVNVDVRISSKYEALLKGLGYEIQGVYDRRIFFAEKNGFAYSFSFDDKAEKYISIGFGIQMDEASASLQERYAAVQYINENFKIVKVYMDDTSAQFSCDHLLFDVANLTEIIDVSKFIMQSAYDELKNKFVEVKV